jgi:cytochrome c oxidase assembly factor CtaG
MTHGHHAFATGSYAVSLILAFIALVYLRGRRLARKDNSNVIPSWSALSFVLGLFLIWVAVASPIAGFVHELLTAHMIQHLLLMTFAAPLIWLGEPLVAFVHALPGSAREAMAPLLRRPSMQRLGEAITHPAVCWLAAAVTLVGCHVPAILALAMESPTGHAILTAFFLGAGLLFWWPVVKPWPSTKGAEWLTVGYLFLATLPCDILSGFLVFCDRLVYPGYLSSSHRFGLCPLEDQQFAGALMWTVVTVVYFIVGGIITARLLSPQSTQERWTFERALPPMARQSAESV